jgi:hypothetical protein
MAIMRRMILIDTSHLWTTLAVVASPKQGGGVSQAFVFWISVLIILATFYFAFDGRLSSDGAIFSTGTALIFGYWLRDQQTKVKQP